MFFSKFIPKNDKINRHSNITMSEFLSLKKDSFCEFILLLLVVSLIESIYIYYRYNIFDSFV